MKVRAYDLVNMFSFADEPHETIAHHVKVFIFEGVEYRRVEFNIMHDSSQILFRRQNHDGKFEKQYFDPDELITVRLYDYDSEITRLQAKQNELNEILERIEYEE